MQKECQSYYIRRKEIADKEENEWFDYELAGIRVAMRNMEEKLAKNKNVHGREKQIQENNQDEKRNTYQTLHGRKLVRRPY